MNENIWDNDELVATLKEGGVAVMPTDTIYGIVGQALNQDTVNRIYEIRKRAPEKPCIVLVSGWGEVEKFGITLSEEQKNKISEFSGAVSIVLDCPLDEFEYLHRETKTLAIRIPGKPGLCELLAKTGPLVAPSANTEGNPPAKNIQEAKAYFGNKPDMYVDGGEIFGKPSRIIRLHTDGTVNILRE